MARKIKILFLAANPIDTDKLKLEEEINHIDDALQSSDYRDYFEIEQVWATHVSDIQKHLLRYKPDIVHFSGHGSEKSEIIFQDEAGGQQAVPQEALSDLFQLFNSQIRCVILNACYSQKQAKAISKYVDFVVGMSRGISDDAAIKFAKAFYRALGYGKDMQFAYNAGRNQINLERLKEQDTPRLLYGKVKPDRFFFIPEDAVADKPTPPEVHRASAIDPIKLMVVGTICLCLLILLLTIVLGVLNGKIDERMLDTWKFFGFAIFLLVTILYLIIRPTLSTRTNQ